ncbi:hypothetical protein QTO34_005606 [Cnephaeus nilssonii]|uniref:MOB kinase activator 3B n=1 Tax=Cnephaeus nilssonii TaxID=3371016 RepID=A0AA40HNM7_CNENI|nr:hypothetical protein QTO34_005606 [Eptesicus nilssonii]
MSIALKQVFNKDKTFRPKRKFEPGTQRFELHKRAQASLNSGVDLKAAVQLPSGEDQNDWVAVHVVDFFNRINLIYGTICEFCTERTCPVMSGGPKYEYRWQDDLKYKKPTALPAPQYMNLLMDWIEVQINNEDIFPTCVGATGVHFTSCSPWPPAVLPSSCPLRGSMGHSVSSGEKQAKIREGKDGCMEASWEPVAVAQSSYSVYSSAYQSPPSSESSLHSRACQSVAGGEAGSCPASSERTNMQIGRTFATPKPRHQPRPQGNVAGTLGVVEPKAGKAWAEGFPALGTAGSLQKIAGNHGGGSCDPSRDVGCGRAQGTARAKPDPERSRRGWPQPRPGSPCGRKLVQAARM